MPVVAVDPTPEVEPEEPEVESSNESMADDPSDDDSYIDEVLNEVKELNIDARPKIQPRYQPPAPVSKQHRVRFADQQPKPVPTRRYPVPGRRLNDPYRRSPAMRDARPVRATPKKRSMMSYGSHYGPGGTFLPTQTKARMLYTHCFG